MPLKPAKTVIKMQSQKNLFFKDWVNKNMGMILYKKIPFIFKEKDYEIKVFYNADTVNIVAFRKHYPANGFRHRINISKSLDMKKILQSNVIDEFTDICKKDIIEKRWDRIT